VTQEDVLLTSHWTKCKDEQTHGWKAQNGHLLYFFGRENRTSAFNKDRVVGLMIRLRAGNPRSRGLISGRGKIFLSYPKLPDRLPAHLKYYPNGKAFDLEVKRLRREANHQPLSSVGVLRLLPYAFIACIRIILLSTGKKIVRKGKKEKHWKYMKTVARIKKWT
jgi:hypothetical protein